MSRGFVAPFRFLWLLLLPAAFANFAATKALADTVSQWNFNSPSPDANSTTGSMEPSTGLGNAVAIGGTSSSFASSNSDGPDPAASDDTVCNLAGFPRVMESNLTAGVEFKVSTRGYENVVVSWGEMHSAAASRYVRPQYTLDGMNYSNLNSITIQESGAWTNFFVSLNGVGGAADNPRFGFRVVAEQEMTALTNSSLAAYRATSTNANYATTGTIRFDMFTVSGEPIVDTNSAPVLTSTIPAQLLRGYQSTAPLTFTVLDAEEPAAGIALEKASSDLQVLPLENITLGGAGANRTVTLRGANVPGKAEVRITATDSGGKSSAFTIPVTVASENSAPVATVPGLAFGVPEAGCTVGVVVQDEETPGDLLTLQVHGERWLPDSALATGGSGTNRWVKITPPGGQAGVVRVQVQVSDGTNTTTAHFPFMLLPSAGLYVYDPFSYADGPVVTNSGFYWATRSGINGQTRTTNGWLRLTESCTEDVVAPLAGGPLSTNDVVYASFKIRCAALPDMAPDYVFHLQGGNSLVGRVYVGRSNAVEGLYRLYVANGSKGVPVDFPMSMSTNVSYTAVLRYSSTNGVSTLWVNPTNEGSTSATAHDVIPSPVAINSVGFRQSSGLGREIWIDELKVGATFAEVLAPVRLVPVLLYEAGAAGLELRWEPGDQLQRASSAGGPFTEVLGASSPFKVEAAGTAPAGFFRLKRN